VTAQNILFLEVMIDPLRDLIIHLSQAGGGTMGRVPVFGEIECENMILIRKCFGHGTPISGTSQQPM
jgi:hypothetical protein